MCVASISNTCFGILDIRMYLKKSTYLCFGDIFGCYRYFGVLGILMSQSSGNIWDSGFFFSFRQQAGDGFPGNGITCQGKHFCAETVKTVNLAALMNDLSASTIGTRNIRK